MIKHIIDIKNEIHIRSNDSLIFAMNRLAVRILCPDIEKIPKLSVITTDDGGKMIGPLYRIPIYRIWTIQCAIMCVMFMNNNLDGIALSIYKWVLIQHIAYYVVELLMNTGKYCDIPMVAHHLYSGVFLLALLFIPPIPTVGIPLLIHSCIDIVYDSKYRIHIMAIYNLSVMVVLYLERNIEYDYIEAPIICLLISNLTLGFDRVIINKKWKL